MNVSTTARHYDLAPALREYAEGKVYNLKRFFDHIVKAHVIFSLEKYRHRVEITLHVNGGDFVSTDESDDMYASVDRAVDKLERQLRKYKEKLIRRKTQQRSNRVEAVEPEDDEENRRMNEDL